MITTEKAFNEAFNLQKALKITNDFHSQYFLKQDEVDEFYRLDIDFNSDASDLLKEVFTLKKHNEYLANELHKKIKQ